jgi:hypothetical protein
MILLGPSRSFSVIIGLKYPSNQEVDMFYWRCDLKKDSSILQSRSIKAEHRLDALKLWIRDYEREFEQEDWNRLEVVLEK